MKCPHCKKDIEFKKIRALEILEIIKKSESPHTVASLSKKIEISRSGLEYYLKQLEKEKKIYRMKLNNVTGSPSLIILNTREEKT